MMHGGDIYRNRVTLDFSVNINPKGIPDSVNAVMATSIFDIDKYPDMECENLREALEQKLSVPRERILCGNGLSELILAICHAKRPKTALLVAPTFEGYETALNAVGTRISYYFLKEEERFELTYGIIERIKEEKPEIVFICNPNNPTGRLVEKNLMYDIARVCDEENAIFVVDECFMELVSKLREYTLVKLEKLFKNMIILRTFSEVYGIPGIRLGYGIFSTEELRDEVARHISEWGVSQMAQNVGVVALRERNFLDYSSKIIEDERLHLTSKLMEFGMVLYPSQANFILFKEKKHDLYHKLLEKEILIRDCKDMMGLERGFYRVAIRKHQENSILIRKLAEIYGQ